MTYFPLFEAMQAGVVGVWEEKEEKKGEEESYLIKKKNAIIRLNRRSMWPPF